jgi:hypothetical protein
VGSPARGDSPDRLNPTTASSELRAALTDAALETIPGLGRIHRALAASKATRQPAHAFIDTLDLPPDTAKKLKGMVNDAHFELTEEALSLKLEDGRRVRVRRRPGQVTLLWRDTKGTFIHETYHQRKPRPGYRGEGHWVVRTSGRRGQPEVEVTHAWVSAGDRHD